MIEKSCNFSCKIAYKIFMYLGINQDGSLVYQTQIARELKTPMSTVNYWVTKFKLEGLIDKYLKLTDRGFKAFKFLWQNENKKILRAHNIQVMFKVINCPKNFPDCFSKSIYQPLTNNRYKGLKTELNGFTVMFYSSKKIVCVIPDIYGDSDDEISSSVQVIIPGLRKLLEAEFTKIELGDYEIAKIQTMHIAVLNSIIARKYLLRGFTKENKDYAIDNSHGIPEIELTNPDTALRDIMDLVNLESMLQKREGEDKNAKRKKNK